MKMEFSNANKKPPILVRLGLWGISNRKTALIFMWLSLGLAVILSVVSGQIAVGLVLSLAALWYLFAIKWVDKNHTWK
jgi:hypothetical protein